MKIRNGFTLIETIIYTAIIGGVIVSFTSFSLSIAALKNKNFVIQETQVNSRIMANIISNYIKNAESVITPEKGTSSPFLVLDMPDDMQDVAIEMNNGMPYLKEGDNEPLAMVSDLIEIKDLEFRNVSQDNANDSIKINFIGTYRNNTSLEFNYNFPVATAISLRK